MVLSPHLKHVILGFILAVVVLAVSWKVVSHLDGVAHDQAVLAKAKLDADLQLAKTQAAQTQTDKTALQNQLNSLVASNAQLQASVAALRSQLANQRKTDATLAPDALAARWGTLLSLPPTEIKPTADGLLASAVAAHATVDALEELPVLKQEEKEAIANSADKDSVIQSQKKVIADSETELLTCKKTITDQDTACKKEIKAVKAAARKHNFMSALGAFIGGFVLGRHKF